MNLQTNQNRDNDSDLKWLDIKEQTIFAELSWENSLSIKNALNLCF